MDAEKLSEELNITADPDRCARESGADCTTANCHWRCALDVIDELLARADNVSGDEVDRLLDLRSQFRRRDDAEAALRLFCELRLQMEQRHYLAFFRIRRWMENHLVATVRLGLSEPRTIRVKLDHYCVIAVRRACLCACLGPDTALVTPRFEFAFRPAIPSAAPEAALQTG